jgi:hypothetical protein
VNEKNNLEDEVDALFRLPLAEFIGTRNELAARLKKEKRLNEAEQVKALVKPPVSAWTVNQLYWKHRNAFDRLMVTGERFRKAQTSRGAGKLADMREALDARRDALTHLSDLATEVLQDAGHNPSPDTIRRITTTLEALSAYASLPSGPRHGRLTQDVDPPGFESLTSTTSSGVAKTSEESARITSQKPVSNVATIKRKPESASSTLQNQKMLRLEDTRQTKIAASDTRQTRIAAARVALQDSKRLLSDARSRVQTAEAAQKKANAELKEAEKEKLEAEEQLDKARAALIDATRRARSIAPEIEKATKALEDAERSVEKARKELEELLSS